MLFMPIEACILFSGDGTCSRYKGVEINCVYLYVCTSCYPTDLVTTLKLPNPSHDVSELHKIRRSSDFEDLKLPKDRSGTLDATCRAEPETTDYDNATTSIHTTCLLTC